MAISFRRLLLLINGILLFAALVISLIFLYAFLSPRGVEDFSLYYLSKYQERGESRALAAINDLQGGETEKAYDLLRRWHDYQAGDRYFAEKRNVAIELARLLAKDGAHQASVDVIQPILEEDERDLPAFEIWANSALEIDELREEAQARTTEFWERFPRREILKELYMRKVYAWDNAAHARALLDTHGYLTTDVDAGWKVFWTEKEFFTGENSEVVSFEKSDTTLTANLELPPGTRLLRFDPPPGAELIISNVSVQPLDKPSKVIDIQNLKLNMISLDDGVLKTDGGEDPYFVLDISDLADGASDNQMDLVISMNVQTIFAGWLVERMEGL